MTIGGKGDPAGTASAKPPRQEHTWQDGEATSGLGMREEGETRWEM